MKLFTSRSTFIEQYSKTFLLFTILISIASCSSSSSLEESDSNQKESDTQTSQLQNTSSQTTKDTSSQSKTKTKTDSEYINSLLPEARRIQKEYGIPLDITLAIARQESGNGDYIIGKGNHFGLRCASDDCITLEKYGQQISYETCPDVSECFNIFAGTIKELTGDKKVTLRRLYQNGYASSPQWVRKVSTIRKEVQKTLSESGIEY